MAFVLCLDSLGSGDELFLHVSRPTKPETPQFSFIQQLEDVRPNPSGYHYFLNLIFTQYKENNNKHTCILGFSFFFPFPGDLIQVSMGKVWNHTQEDQPARVYSSMGT